MELGKELFVQIVSALGEAARIQKQSAGQATAEHAEKRSADRIALSADITVAPFGVMLAKPRQAKLRSLSRSGAAILDRLTRQAGDKLVLYLPRSNGNPIPIVCMVMNTRICGGEFRVGVKFLSRAEETAPAMLRSADGLVNRPTDCGSLEILDAIANDTGAKRGADRHGGVSRSAKSGLRAINGDGQEDREQRVELNVQAMAASYEQGRTGPMYFVTVKDISLGGGVCILQPDPMRRGEQFVLQIPRSKGKPLTLICTTAGCRRLDDDNLRIGARYEAQLLSGDRDNAARVGLLRRVRSWFSRKPAA